MTNSAAPLRLYCGLIPRNISAEILCSERKDLFPNSVPFDETLTTKAVSLDF